MSMDDSKRLRARGRLMLEDGTEYSGWMFGAPVAVAGEVVFNTGMVGYPETLTDPSYAGQILVLTYPLIGNYGVPSDERDELGLKRHFESERVQVAALIVASASDDTSHWQAERSLPAWLRDAGTPGLAGLDTRALATRLRERGAMLGRLLPEGEDLPWHDPNLSNLVARVSIGEPRVYGRDGPRVVVVDCGMKESIVRGLVRAGARVVRVPWDHDFFQEDFQGVLVSNGPGDPKMARATVQACSAGDCRENPVSGSVPWQSDPGAGRGSGYLQTQVRPSLPEPTLCRSRHAAVLHHIAKPRLRRSRGGAAGRVARVVCECQRWNQRGNSPRLEADSECAVPSGGETRADRYAGVVRAICGDAEMNQPARSDHRVATGTHGPRREFPRKVVLLGSGALKIGEAGEFDYSGTQAIKALMEEGIEVIVINPNIATTQTSGAFASRVYFLPVTPRFVESVLAREKAEAMLLGFGGQTALNCGVTLHRAGALERLSVRVLGTPVRAIETTEDRELFKCAMKDIGADVAESQSATTVEHAKAAARKIGYPVMVRAAFTLGGLESGVCRDEAELERRVVSALAHAPQVLVEESLAGWKEVEYEVVRDSDDNCITVCNMENLDPMGIHTGESIVVAPSQTLTNDEYHGLREVAIRVIRHLKIVGECNIQFALHPRSWCYRIIEVNARLSRSSALASKATGYPLAFIAAKLALGYALPELPNKITEVTGACFEPALDYVVVKVPRWDLEKFRGVSPRIGSAMKSVGEVMAIGAYL